MATQIIEFPLDEVSDRVRHILQILPPLGDNLIDYQEKVSMRHSQSGRMDYAMMQKADQFVKYKLFETIQAQFSEDRIVSSAEDVPEGDGDFQWWIDPVDGARNFIHGVPLFCIAVGLCFREIPVAGVVLVPALGDLYHAIYGSGAFKNDVGIQVSAVENAERTVIATGLPFKRQDIISDLISDISAFVSSGAGIRRTGSIVLDLCWIAEGRFDALWERAIKPRDICGTSVILAEAGGRISDFDGRAFQLEFENIVASNGFVHDHVVLLLGDARKVEGMN